MNNEKMWVSNSDNYIILIWFIYYDIQHLELNDKAVDIWVTKQLKLPRISPNYKLN